MTTARRRGRPAPLRWGGSLALAGIALAVVGGYVQYGDQAGAITPTPPEPAAIGTPPSSVTPPPARPRPSTASGKPSTPAAKRAVPPPARPGKPSQLSVPQLHVSAPVVGIAAEQGSLTPPSNPQRVGWWTGGAQPGASRGSAVITGHTVHDGGGAFDNLEQLRPGAPIVVTTSRGQLRYRVTGVTTYRKQALAKNAAKVFDQNVPGRLVLITCEDWNGKVYLSNVVVVAERMA